MALPQRWQRDPEVAEPLPDQRTLVLMAQELMARVLQSFASQGVTPPERQIIYMAPIPVDCEQLSVLFSQWTPLPPAELSTTCVNLRWFATFNVVVSRCTPAQSKDPKKAPTPAQMLAAATMASQDAEVMLNLVNTGLTEVGSELEVLTPAATGGFQTVELTVQLPAAGGLD